MYVKLIFLRMQSERVSEEVKAIRRLSGGRVYAKLENHNTVIIALPGPPNTPWADGLYSIVVKFPEGKIEKNECKFL